MSRWSKPAYLMSPCASRRYLPVLRGFPAKYIYDPWNAPESVQAAAKCVIGVHYPKPMVHHAEASRLNIERMKQIYQQLSRYRGLGESRLNNLGYSLDHQPFPRWQTNKLSTLPCPVKDLTHSLSSLVQTFFIWNFVTNDLKFKEKIQKKTLVLQKCKMAQMGVAFIDGCR